ncbi:MAG: glycosyl transferase family 2 [Deltaproteobacteria bacterium]|nr:glycosyl transferase family 2 [Deltaproteobacteria bacterium]
MLPEKTDILAGIASYNNAGTIGHVVKAVDAGLSKYFGGKRAVIVNSDGGSIDGTTDAVRTASFEHEAIFTSHPAYAINRISMPYDGIPGKGSAFKAIFRKAVEMNAGACCVVDADLRSITPEWIELLVSPVLNYGFDFVAPLYSRHKYDGTITNSIVYPMTRALYGKRIRQPIGGEFGFSGRLAEYYLGQDVWETEVARFGIDIWMTTEALANGFRVCQTFLGAKIHDPKDPGADLSDMMTQVVSTLFSLAERHSSAWREINGSLDVPTFGFRHHVGLDPVRVNIERMLRIFRLGVKELGPIWSDVLGKGDFRELERIAGDNDASFRFPQSLWTRLVYDYAIAFHKKRLPPGHLIKSLVPLYLGRTASFFMEAADMGHNEAENAVETLCAEFEANKGYLVNNWK